jgi:DNA-binding NarL/FixJ family response regulator
MNVLIIDDHEMFSQGIINRVQKVFKNAKCYFANNVRSAYALLHQYQMDLVICDLEFDNDPQHDGFYMIEKLLELEPKTKVIALTHYNSYRIMKKAKQSGFMSFLNKGSSFEDFKNTLQNVVLYGEYKSETEKKLIKKRQLISASIFNDSIKGIYLLSKRELELTLLTVKTTNRKELAKYMNIEPYTIDSHFKSILHKLNLTNRKELAMFAYDYKERLEKALKEKLS